MEKQSEKLSLNESISDPVVRKAADDETFSSDEDAPLDSVESYDEDENHSNEDEGHENDNSNPGWADAMAKVLSTKKPKRKKNIILAKAKKFSTESKAKNEKLDFEIEGNSRKQTFSKPDIQDTTLKKRTVAQSRTKSNVVTRVKPNVLDKDREKRLNKIATKGVVQLFNAVRTQQKNLEVKLSEAGGSVRKRDKVMKSLDKKAFLDVLMGNAISQPVDNPVKTEEQLKEEKEEDATQPEWQVLRDDFMMDTTRLKDWDKQETIKFEVDQKSDIELSS